MYTGIRYYPCLCLKFVAGKKEWLDRLRAFRGRLPADFKFDRDEANAR